MAGDADPRGRGQREEHEAVPRRPPGDRVSTRSRRRPGEQAVELAVEHAPDLVLMDIQLPDIDGVEALGRLRADERTASIPVLALTAQAMHGDRERFLAAGFDGYLSKPVEHRRVRRDRESALRRSRSMSERRRRGSSSSTTSPRTCACSRRCSTPAATTSSRPTDGRAALELVESANPDLVLLDVMMPEMDGYAVCRRLRERRGDGGAAR